jgi:hypothetical protein
VCLAAGLRCGYTVLTENGGTFFAPRVLNLGVAVWRAFEVLVEAWRRELVQDIVGEPRRYEQETLGLHPETSAEAEGCVDLLHRDRGSPGAQWISGLDLDHFRDLMRRARIPVVN